MANGHGRGRGNRPGGNREQSTPVSVVGVERQPSGNAAQQPPPARAGNPDPQPPPQRDPANTPEDARQPRPSLDQRRSAYAWEKVTDPDLNPHRSKYTNLAKAAPALIMNNGLMQTLAFYQEKSKEQANGTSKEPHYQALGKHLREWLVQRFEVLNDPGYQHLVTSLHHHQDRALYRQATEEALQLLRWIRQFAAAVENTPPTAQGGN